ncbi:putative dynein light chain 1, cytoplasmic [Schistosoma mansoni]|uniref:putative dynein light chain 1, cytoplasmic n=1 Tax=Schistosoma mansoni TaxID=6183 RepID=UPI00022DC0A7|nr:putative dynein light chain 1, cytoplasmic [Schistosoma mansoni]|eukprot:XP_018649280.1 putative dynein light chain 1, cytoplasmic [Schistosoma mansoni]
MFNVCNFSTNVICTSIILLLIHTNHTFNIYFYSEIIRRNTTQQNAALFKLGSDIEYISGDMMLSQQINVTNEARKLYQEYKSENKLLIATKLKEFLDKTFGRAWHVTVVDGSFASAHTEEVNTSFHFKMKNLCFIIWKTPDCRNE